MSDCQWGILILINEWQWIRREICDFLGKCGVIFPRFYRTHRGLEPWTPILLAYMSVRHRTNTTTKHWQQTPFSSPYYITQHAPTYYVRRVSIKVNIHGALKQKEKVTIHRVSAKQKRPGSGARLAVGVRPAGSSIDVTRPPWNSCHPAASVSERLHKCRRPLTVTSCQSADRCGIVRLRRVLCVSNTTLYSFGCLTGSQWSCLNTDIRWSRWRVPLTAFYAHCRRWICLSEMPQNSALQ